jgi:hypothetical protein
MPSIEASFRIVRDLTLDLLYFPIWWYSTGLMERVNGAGELITGASRSLQIGLWIRNIFVPMYGAYDWQSRLISVFMRCVQIVARVIALVFWVLVAFAFFALYVFGPIMLILLFAYHAFLSGQASYYGA